MANPAQFLFYLFKAARAVIQKGKHSPDDIDIDNPYIENATEVSDHGILRFDRF